MSEPPRPVVLVVDDAPDSLRLLCDALEDAGYTVLLARDGGDALATFEIAMPDAVPAPFLADAVARGEARHARAAGSVLVARHVGAAGLNESTVLLSLEAADDDRVARAALTPRETEVLSWLAKGKTNRDIADIL